MSSKVVVQFEPDGKRVFLAPGDTLLSAAEKAGINLRSECGGRRFCGKCRVIIVKGQSNLDLITSQEIMLLTPKEVHCGFRLACCCVVKGGEIVVFVPLESKVAARRIQVDGLDRAITLNPPVTKFHVSLLKPTIWDFTPDLERLVQSLQKKGFASIKFDHELLKVLPVTLRNANWDVTATIWNGDYVISVEKGNTEECKYGFAVDIGTSKIVGQLVNLHSGKIVATKALENPQIIYGEDIISRITHATESYKALKELQRITIKAINSLILGCSRKAGIDPKNIYEITIVGNTAMHHFFLGIIPEFLAISPYIPAVKKALDLKANYLGIHVNALANIHVLPIVAGYVGSDAVADVLATGINETEYKCLLIDIGTNSEVFVGNEEGIVCCSCAAGPAFEGMHIEFGMKARTGAIEKLKIDPDTYEVEYETIGNEKPIGICGSGIIDAMAEMFKCGILNQRRFNKNIQTKRLVIDKGELKFVVAWREETGLKSDITISSKDVQEIQLAKAAIHAATMVLMAEKNLTESDLDRVFIAGAFGNNLNIENAIFIGLLPDVPTEKFGLVGNTAISGARMALLSKDVRKEAEDLSKNMQYIELMAMPNFRKEFMNSMFIPYRDMRKYPRVCKFFAHRTGTFRKIV